MSDAQGFCGVRFNPYLWPQGGAGMQDETGLALYRKAGELDMPVGVMCFKGLGLHIEDIHALLESSPQTKVCVACLPVSRPFLFFRKMMRAQVSLKSLESLELLEYSTNRGRSYQFLSRRFNYTK